MIRIVRSGALDTIQDLGRAEGRRWGVGRAGAMDPVSLRLANALLGDAPDEAAIEVGIFPFEVMFETPCAFAVTGAGSARLDGRPIPANWAQRVAAGASLRIEQGPHGVFGYLAFAGGLDVPPRLGARATDLKGRFGGLDGAPLAAGQTLRLRDRDAAAAIPAEGYGAAASALPSRRSDGSGETCLRALPAAEWEAFTEAARFAFADGPWTVGREVNRTGYRLSGPDLRTREPLDLLSHGLVSGVVQVPPSGQPIVQMADANTCGGYPKIATVIAADLWALAQARSGETVRFRIVAWEDAVREQRDLDRRLQALDNVLRDARRRSADDAAPFGAQQAKR